MRIPGVPPSDDENKAILAEAMEPEKLEALKSALDKINSDYLHWDEIRLRYGPREAKILWAYTNFVRGISNRPITINGLNLRYIQSPQIEKTLHYTDMEIGKKIEFLEELVPSPNLKRKYLVSSLMEEAIASSQLEGAVTTRAVAKRMLRENRKPRTRSEEMIYNNYITMKYIKDLTQSKVPLSLDIIKEIQRRITKNTLKHKGWEGTFREDNDAEEFGVYDLSSGQLLHKPPNYKDIEKLLQKVIAFANSEPTEYYLHPIVKAVVLHYMVGYIHPFYDGNGRTARALFYWYMISQGYDSIEYIAVSLAIKNAPIQYTMAYLYSETDHNDITYFVRFHLDKIRIAINSFDKYIEGKKNENKRVIQTIGRDGKLNLRQADIIINMSRSEKTMTISEMQSRYSTTYQTARADLLELVKLGYMHKILAGKQFLFRLDKEKCMTAMEEGR